MKRFLPLAALVVLLPAAAFAMESTFWDFRGAPLPGMDVQKLTTVEATAEGLYVETQTDGFLQFPTLTRGADSLTLQATNARDAEAALIWRTPALNPGEYYQHNIVIPLGESKTVTVALNQIPEWEWSAPFVGLALPAGSRMLIETIEWRTYTVGEKLWNGVVSFWTPDTFRLYSINFLWGPLIGSTPEARMTLYETLPPSSWSATRLFYGAFALAAGVAGLLWWSKPEGGKRRFLLILAFAGAALWIVFDARMTEEILSYVRDDWRSYVLAPADERTLRSHSNLYDIVYEAKELLGDDPRYVLVAQENTPFFSNLRYALYPSVPVQPGEAGVSAYIVLARPDITVVNGKIMDKDGSLTAGSGSIVKRFDDASFFFRTEPQ